MADVAELSEAELTARLALLQIQQANADRYNTEAQAEVAEAKAAYRFVRPLADAADSLIDYLRNTDGRIMFGLPEIDLLTRGFGPGELIYVTGYTASGKTQLFLTMVINNRDRKVVLFTMDEPVELVLTKLVCMRTGSNAERMEERVRAGDQEAINRVRRIAREDFRNLIVVDQSMSLDDMTVAIQEVQDYWGEPPAAIGIDYLELLRSDDTAIDQKSQALKGWASCQTAPVICLHQGSRGNSAGGQRLTMRSMKYGGEQEAIVVIGVRRQRDDDDLDDYERAQVADTVDISVLKNKRPPAKIGEFTFYMDSDSGLITPLSRRPEPTSAAASRHYQQQNIYDEEDDH